MFTRSFAYYIRSVFSYLYYSEWLNSRKQPVQFSIHCTKLNKNKLLQILFKASAYVNSELIVFLFCFSVQMYMSPELVLCRGHNTKTDIYSLGTTIIHMLSGSPPWVRRYPRTDYPSYLFIVSVLIRYYQNALNCLNF